jgi:hypothetical protein
MPGQQQDGLTQVQQGSQRGAEDRHTRRGERGGWCEPVCVGGLGWGIILFKLLRSCSEIVMLQIAEAGSATLFSQAEPSFHLIGCSCNKT